MISTKPSRFRSLGLVCVWSSAGLAMAGLLDGLQPLRSWGEAGIVIGLCFWYAGRRADARIAELVALSSTDPLTGLWNRRHLDERLAFELKRAIREERPLSLIALDIDDLKATNDRRGHSGGDVAIQIVATAIRASVRGHDVAARTGGDEFVVVLPGAGIDEARRIAERIRSDVNTATVGSSPVQFASISAGIAGWHEETTTPGALLEAVDLALYEAKRNGRNQVATTAPPRQAASPVGRAVVAPLGTLRAPRRDAQKLHASSGRYRSATR